MAKSFPNTGATVIDTVADLPAASGALEGVMMFQKDTNELKICDGSSWISMLDTDVPPAMQIITPTSVSGTGVTNSAGNVSFSGSSTVSVNGVFSSAFDNYKLVINMTNNSVNGSLYLRMRTAGTDNSSANYTFAGLNSYSGSSITSAITSAGTTAYFIVSNMDTANYSNMPVTFDILQPFLSYRTAYYGFLPNPVSPQSYFCYVGGAMSVTTSYDGFSILNGSGGTISGNLRVYGYRNS
jgi:hypothetical protein